MSNPKTSKGSNVGYHVHWIKRTEYVMMAEGGGMIGGELRRGGGKDVIRK